MSDTKFIDQSVDQGKDYIYEIKASKKISDEKKNEIKKQLKELNVDLSTIDKETQAALFNETKSVVKIVQVVDELTEAELSVVDVPKVFEQARQKDGFQTQGIPHQIPAYFFRYATFIPFATVDNPNSIHEALIGEFGTRLKGDNRGLDPFPNSSRTKIDVWADMAILNDLYYDREVGESVLYASDGRVLMRDTASVDGIRVYEDYEGSDKMMWRITHDVGVPFHASYPNINLYVEGTVYRNGSLFIRGSHDKAPNHELYAAPAYTDYTPIRIYDWEVDSEADFYFLMPGMPQQYYEVSM